MHGLDIGTNKRPLRLVTLNIWGGRVEEFPRFITSKQETTDVFCFQETGASDRNTVLTAGGAKGMLTAIHNQLQSTLNGHRGELFSTQHGYDHDEPVDYYLASGNAIFVRAGIPVTGSGREFVYGHQDSLHIPTGWHTWPRNVCWNTLALGDTKLCVMSLHGYWNHNKRDCPERIDQAKRVRKVMEALRVLNGQDMLFVLAGDFNLDPDTESMDIMLGSDMVNLVTERGITNTRTPFYRKYGVEGASMFADHILVSKGLRVPFFQVCPEHVSDHAALEAHIVLS